MLAWVDAQMIETLYLSAATVVELRFGLATMPIGKRRDTCLDRLEREIIPAFAGRVLPFELDASHAYAELVPATKAAGNAIRKTDGYIAASVAARGYTVATHDTSLFEAAGLAVIASWEAHP